MDKKILLTAVIFGLFAIVLGAFAAHGLKKIIQAEQLISFETGVKYLMYHALFLLFLGTTQYLAPEQKTVIFYLTLFGTILFSGSIFLLATSSATGINFRFLGPVTPIGGLLLIGAWFWFFVTILRK